MRVFIRLFMFIASLLSSLVAAQTPADPSGHWEGIVQIPEHPMNIEVDLVLSTSGSPSGTFGQPAQGIKALPLTTVSVKDRTVRFVVKGNDQGSTFAGVIAADGQVMSGEVTAGEYVIPFTLTRIGAARQDRGSTPVTALLDAWDEKLAQTPAHRQARLLDGLGCLHGKMPPVP